MTRWPSRYYFLQRDKLESELYELCLRLRRSRQELNRPPGPAELRAGAEDRAAQRCYVSPRDCADFDFPRLLEADEEVVALLRTLNEAAALLYYFANSGRSAAHSDRYPPS